MFTRTKHRADRLTALSRNGRASRPTRIHGNRSQAQRTLALAGFKSGEYPVLVATDIAARGIDVEALGHVVNFDVPVAPRTTSTASAGRDAPKPPARPSRSCRREEEGEWQRSRRSSASGCRASRCRISTTPPSPRCAWRSRLRSASRPSASARPRNGPEDRPRPPHVPSDCRAVCAAAPPDRSVGRASRAPAEGRRDRGVQRPVIRPVGQLPRCMPALTVVAADPVAGPVVPAVVPAAADQVAGRDRHRQERRTAGTQESRNAGTQEAGPQRVSALRVLPDTRRSDSRVGVFLRVAVPAGTGPRPSVNGAANVPRRLPRAHSRFSRTIVAIRRHRRDTAVRHGASVMSATVGPRVSAGHDVGPAQSPFQHSLTSFSGRSIALFSACTGHGADFPAGVVACIAYASGGGGTLTCRPGSVPFACEKETRE